MSRSKTFVLQWLDAVALADVPTGAKAVALAMATHADYGSGQNMRAGTARLAQMAGLGDRQTRSMIKALKLVGLITWDGVLTAPGKARNYTLTVPDRAQANSGSGVPPMAQETTDNSGSQVPPSRESTAAISDANGGNIRRQRRQPTATHQGHTRARPARALRGAPDGRPAARNSKNSDALTGIVEALTFPNLSAPRVEGLPDEPESYVSQTITSGSMEFDLQITLSGEHELRPIEICVDHPDTCKIKNSLIHWRDRFGLLANIRDYELDQGYRQTSVDFRGELSAVELKDALPELMRVLIRHSQGNKAPTSNSPSPNQPENRLAPNV
jgi:hypothetical protein